MAKLAPVKISVAESLVWRVAAFASALSAAAEAASQSDPVANTVAAAKASSSLAMRSAMGGSGSNASIGARSNHLEGGGSGLPLQVDFLNIEDIKLSLSFKTDPSSRPKSSSHLMSVGLDFLELEDLSLTIPGIERERVRMPKAMLFGLIVEGLQQRMIGIAFSLLRNYGVLGSASKILNAATSGVSKGLEVTKKDPIPSASTPRGGGGAAQRTDPSKKGSSAGPSSSSAGSSRADVRNIGDGVFEAGKAFAMNLFDGARGIVAKPIQGAEKGFGGFIEGVGKGLLGAVAAPVTGTLVAFSKVAEGLDSSYASVKSSILSMSQRRITRRRLPRPFLGDRVLKPFLLDAALGQALLYDSCVSSSGLLSLNLSQIFTGRRRGGRGGGGGGGEGPAYPFRSDLYESHFILNGAQVLVITNRRLVLLDASDFVWLQKRVMSGQPLGNISEVPGGDVVWQLTWEGLLAAEVAWHSQTPGLPPDGLVLHRKRRGGPDNSILHDLRCRPGTSQAQEVLAAIQACRYKHYLLPKSEAAGWRELRGLQSDRPGGEGEGGNETSSLALTPSPDQLKPDTMPSVEFKPIWYRKALSTSNSLTSSGKMPWSSFFKSTVSGTGDLSDASREVQAAQSCVPLPSPHVTIEEEEEQLKEAPPDLDISLSTFFPEPEASQDAPSSSSPLSPFSASLSKPARKTNVRFQDDPAPALRLSPSNSAAMYNSRESAAKRERSMRREQNIKLIETLQRLNETPTTVYYLGSLHLRMKTLSDGLKQTLHDIWFEPFRLIYNNMHNEAEAWLIPLKSLIELGMMVEV